MTLIIYSYYYYFLLVRDQCNIQQHMLQDKLPELIRLTYNIKVLVAASYKAKESLAAKGLSPAIFLDRFYRDKSQGPNEVSFRFKQRQMRPLPDYQTIDMDDYALMRRDEKDSLQDIDEEILSKKILQSVNAEQLKYLRETDKSVFADKSSVQKFMNNQSFHWFQNCNKTFYYALSLGQQNFRVSTCDQPLGLCYIVQVEKQKTARDVFDKIRNQKDLLLKKLFQLNPQQQKNVKAMMIILFDVSQNCTIQQALDYTTYFKQNANIHSSLIFRLAINGDDIADSIQWSRFNRPILNFNYNLKSSDPVRIIANEQFNKVQEVIWHHKEIIRKNFEARLDQLAKKHEQVNKATKIIASFFRGSTPNDKTYTKEELDLRELADKMFILQDYKRAYDIYKSIASKMDKRNGSIETNIAQMIQLCIVMSKFHNIKLRSDPYNEIQKYSQKIFKFYENRSKNKLKKYLIFLVYVFHTFKVFDRHFIRSIFYTNLKGTFSTSNPMLNVVSILIYQQFANMNLFYNNIEYRRYCYDLTRVASRFSQVKMYNYALRCFLIVQSIYRDSFANIEKYEQTQLSHLLLQIRNFRQSLKCLKFAWQIYVQRIETEDLQKNEQQLIKHIDNYNKMLREIEKLAPNQLGELIYPNLKIPLIHALNLQTKDQMLQFDQKSGTKWQDIGDAILDNKELMSAGLNLREFRNIFKSFDYGVPQQKYLIHKFNSSNFTQMVLKKNSRNAYVREPIKLSFYMRNPLRLDIEVNHIKVLLKNMQGVKIEVENQNNKTIKAFKSEQVSFVLTPIQPGFLEVQRIEWFFMKLLSEHRIKQPQQIMSDAKSCYFKLNVHPAVGCLEAKARFEDNYYEGQKAKMKIKFINIGEQKITKIYIACDEDEIFSFKSNEINVQIEPKQQKQFQFDISIPLVHPTIQSGQQKKINKLLFLYKTADKYRICRTINKFNILRIAKIENIQCERLSTHLHLLSFSKRKSLNKDDARALQWMILPPGYEIVKKQAADLSEQTNYFFFIRKGNYQITKFQFENWAKQISSYPKQFINVQQPQDNNTKVMNIRFLWRKQQRYGYLSKLNIPININEHAYLSSIYPINFRIKYQKEIKHNFKKNPFLEVPIEIKLKNVLYNDELKLIVNFIDGVESDSSWEGITEKKMTLALGNQQIIHVKYVVVRPGIYDLSNQIKYKISNSKLQAISITHSQYEQIYLTIRSDTTDSKIDFEDAFKQFTGVVGKPTQNKIESESLI